MTTTNTTGLEFEVHIVERLRARTRCAEILNARAASKPRRQCVACADINDTGISYQEHTCAEGRPRHDAPEALNRAAGKASAK